MKKLIIIIISLLSLSGFGQSLLTNDGFPVYFMHGGRSVALTEPPFNLGNLYIEDSIITGKNSTMNGSNSWVTGLGSLNPDMTTYPGYMFLNFTTSNQAVKLTNACIGYVDLQIKIKIRRISGNNQSLHIGRKFASSPDVNYETCIWPTTNWHVYTYTLRVNDDANPTLWIGTPTAYNIGSDFLIDYVTVMKVSTNIESNEDVVFANIPKYTSNRGSLLDSLQAYNGYLAKIGIVGNSIMANYYGGNIPIANDEGATNRPPRLTINNVPRRIYDTLWSLVTGFNKAIYRRCDNAAWTYSGSWTYNNGTATTAIINPRYTTAGHETNFRYTTTAGGYAEITIPNGYENCAVIYHSGKQNFGVNNQDAITVTLNGSSIAAYGSSTINSYRNTSATFTGNPYTLSEYHNLPAGANTIRVTNGADAEALVLWGIMYWHGKSLIVINEAYGGWSFQDMFTNGRQQSQLLNLEPIERSWDFVLLEVPGMNENSDNNSLTLTQIYMESIMNIVGTQKIAVYTTHPFGCSDVSCTTNYYTTYNNPVTLDRRYERCYNWMYYNGFEAYNIFKDFKTYASSQGFSLESGEIAKTLTTDGQHPSTLCAKLFIDYLVQNLLK